MKSSSLGQGLFDLPDYEEMPVLFMGHGNPMNAIEDNAYSRLWKELGKKLPAPKAILVVSAHWETNGTKVLASEKPRTIHDFYGFPQKLFDQQFPAPGAPSLAEETKNLITKTAIELDHEWGFDHGTWSVLLPMYPEARIPVYQLSLDRTKGAAYHYDLALQLQALRKKGVMIIGSGNIVHNLGRINWQNPKPFDWALEFDEKIREAIATENHQVLIDYEKLGQSAFYSVPSNEHYLPMLYSMGVRKKGEQAHFFNESIDLGSISMRSVIFGFDPQK